MKERVIGKFPSSVFLSIERSEAEIHPVLVTSLVRR